MTDPNVDAFPILPLTTTSLLSMDATEDRDLKLQRASGDLVSDFSVKLPSLLWRSQNGTPLRTPRKWVQVTQTERLVSLVSSCMLNPRNISIGGIADEAP